MHYTYRPEGVCSTRIDFDIEDGRMHNVVYENGCNGNLKSIGILVEGMDARELVKKLRGVSCRGGPTSCCDQLARAVQSALAEQV